MMRCPVFLNVLSGNPTGKSDVWKNFSLVFEQRHDVRGLAPVEKLIELKYTYVSVTVTYSSYNVVSTSDWNNAISRSH